MEEPTNRELYLMIDANHKETMKEISYIKEQTTKTNGRVTKSCEEIENLKLWKANIIGKAYILPLIVAGIISGLIGLLFKKF